MMYGFIDRQTIREAVLIIVIAAVAGFGINLFHPAGFQLVSREALNYKKILLISTPEARIKYDSSLSIFVDSRSPAEFEESRIPGALNIPTAPEALSWKRIREYFPRLNEPVELVIYCSGTSCGTSEQLARRFLGMGYSRHIYIIRDGIPDWETRGYPVEGKGKQGITE